MEPKDQYQPKVNEKRQVVGELPGGLKYCLRPPTNRDLIAIEQLAKECSGSVDIQLRTFSLLSGVSQEELLDLDAESTEVMGKALELFPVFSNKV